MMRDNKGSKVPTVSVILPTYNRAEIVKRSILSVLNQTYKDFELIIIDDASTDKTRMIVEELGDTRIKYLRNRQNLGPAASRNIGIKASRGIFIAFQDSDDEWRPDKLKKQVETIEKENNKIGVIYSGTIRRFKNNYYYIKAPRNILNKRDVFQRIIPTPSVLVKRECIEKCGFFDKSFPALEEWDLWIRINRYYKFRYLDKLQVISNYTSSSLSTNRIVLAKATFKILVKHINEFISRPVVLLNNLADIIRLFLVHYFLQINFLNKIKNYFSIKNDHYK